MMPQPQQSYVRSALFVDFDNIFIELEKENRTAAEIFGTEPSHWVRWMEKSLPNLTHGELDHADRSILMRNCYLNPEAMRAYRPFFVNAGFRVVDCPELTKQHKNAADIHLALDAVEALSHPTRFDEFIILSADADYTPVNYRLRAHDRRIVMFAPGPASAVIRASCDLMISPSQFLEEALRAEQPRHSSERLLENAARDGHAEVRVKLIALVRDLLKSADRPIPATELGKELKAQYSRDIGRTGWVGFGGMVGFLASAQDEKLRVTRTGPNVFVIYDPQRHSVQEYDERTLDEFPTREMWRVWSEVQRLAIVPRLSPYDYAVVFQEIAEELRANSCSAELDRDTFVNAISERCHARVHPDIGHEAIREIVQALDDQDASWRGAGNGVTAEGLAGIYANEILRLCRSTGMVFSMDDRNALLQWLCGNERCHQEALTA